MTHSKTRILALLLFVAGLPAGAATNIFTPATGTWNLTTNWTLGAVPTSADTAFINSARVATVAANAPDVGSINLGNTADPTASGLIIEANLTTNSLFVATAAGALAEVVQTGGTMTINSAFGISANGTAAASGTYTISGGALDFSGATLNVGGSAPGTLTVDGSAVGSVAGNGMNVGAQGTVRFNLAQFGVTPINITTNVNVNATGQLVVDGTAYEGLDGYFPLITYDAIGPQFDPANVTFIGLDDRAPGIVHESGGLWLRLSAPPAYSTKLLSLVPESTVAADYTGSNFSATRELDPSGSDWATTWNEGHVMDTLLEVDVPGEPNLSFELRTARGGNIYSLLTSEGETVPPQYHPPGDTAPWIDEVWQAVGVDGALNDPGNGSPWFIHQAGVYLRDPILTEPFYSPQVAAELDVANRSFTTINWGQQAHIQVFTDADPSNDWQSHLLYFTRYKDLGQGVIEVSIGYYNYGPDEPEFFDVPWGGTRRTTMNHGFLADPICSTGFTWS
ncbi:MAG: hypothetical protein HKO57_03905, partial [Akkermansiaceae bacterium]|nr:hypothetical protein [Akkermansiaceae bacterium]